MSFLDELKRRNVFRVGIAYVVGAWLLLQFTEVITELLSLPASVGPIVVSVVAIGLPVALFLAWAYELTPQGIKRESEVDRSNSISPQTGRKLNGLIMGMLSLAVVILLVDKFMLREQATMPANDTDVSVVSEPGAATETSTAPEIDPHSIAVLPFTNRSPEANDEFFIDGIHDDLLTNLARVGDLKVISRTSVSRYRDTEMTIPEIAGQLGVATIMEGAVQRAGNTVRINVQLIDAGTDEHLWAEIFDRELTTENLFSIQSEIAEKIAQSLKATLTPEEVEQIQSRPTENLAAYSAYLRGMRAFERRQVDTMQEALEEFRRATELDPEFAQAWAGMAWVGRVMPSWGAISTEEGDAIAWPAAERALAINPNLGESQLAMALAYDDAVKSKPYFERSIELLPGYAPAYQWYANALQDSNTDPEIILALLTKAVELDPLSPIFQHQVARQLIFMGRFKEAEVAIGKLIEVDPQFFPAVNFMGLAVASQGRLVEAISWDQRAYSLDPQSPYPLGGQIFSLLLMQDREMIEAVGKLIPNHDRPANDMLEGLKAASLAFLDGRPAAAVESMKGVESVPFFIESDRALAYMATMARDYSQALSSFQTSDPDFFQADTRAHAIQETTEMACSLGYVMARMGEPEEGKALVEATIAYIETELSNIDRHARMSGRLHHCYAITGDYEESLALMETLFQHGHYEDWWERRYLEYFEPLNGEPRYEALMEQIAQEMARQREELRRQGLIESSGP